MALFRLTEPRLELQIAFDIDRWADEIAQRASRYAGSENMGTYERTTVAPVADALRLAEDFLTARIPLQKLEENGHSVTLRGGDGVAVISAHRHGLDTVVGVRTDQVHTSRIDVEVQHYLNQLPYQPGDVPRL